MKLYSIRFIRNIFFVFVMMFCSILGTGLASAQDREITVTINGNMLFFDVPPAIIDSHVFVPLRVIFEAHGALIRWDGQYRLIEAIKGSHTIQYPIDGTIMYVDGRRINLDLEAVIINNRTLVPIRAISEALGSDVKWDNSSKTISITIAENTPSANQPSDIKLALTADARSKLGRDSNAHNIHCN